MRIVAIVQARIGSSRLPGKSLMPVCGMPMIRHVLNRVMSAGWDDVWLATSLSDLDTPLAEEARLAGVNVHRGSEWDVLGRTHEAAQLAKADLVVRVTGDCPLWAPDVGRLVADQYMRGAENYVIVTNDTRRSGWPDGLDTEVFAFELLDQAAKQATVQRDREHVTTWMTRERVHHVVLNVNEDRRDLKLSVDVREDFERVKAVLGVVPVGQYVWPVTLRAVEQLGLRGSAINQEL